MVQSQCLEIWREDGDADRHMHFVHFGFALGYSCSPLVATQFLSRGSGDLGKAGTSFCKKATEKQKKKKLKIFTKKMRSYSTDGRFFPVWSVPRPFSPCWAWPRCPSCPGTCTTG